MSNLAQSSEFSCAIKFWRNRQKMSQLDLALAANVSQRHVSWLETGRSQPSREMVLRLAEAMDIPLRDRNSILQYAGFAHIYSDHDLSEPEMEPFRDVLADVLNHHMPYPAMVLDRHWHVLMQNLAAQKMLTLMFSQRELGEFTNSKGELNLALISLHPHGLRPFVSNWSVAGPRFYQRLKNEATSMSDPILTKIIDEFADQIEISEAGELTVIASEPLQPVLPLQLQVNGRQLDICSVISTFGTAQDITANELKIEAFYPNNAPTRDFFHAELA